MNSSLPDLRITFGNDASPAPPPLKIAQHHNHIRFSTVLPEGVCVVGIRRRIVRRTAYPMPSKPYQSHPSPPPPPPPPSQQPSPSSYSSSPFPKSTPGWKCRWLLLQWQGRGYHYWDWVGWWGGRRGRGRGWWVWISSSSSSFCWTIVHAVLWISTGAKNAGDVVEGSGRD